MQSSYCVMFILFTDTLHYHMSLGLDLSHALRECDPTMFINLPLHKTIDAIALSCNIATPIRSTHIPH